MTESQFKAFIINLLRRGTYRWPARSEAFRKSRISRGIYICNMCNSQCKAKEVSADHVSPVVDPVHGFIDWNTYITRMFPGPDGFQILCKMCHDNKTNNERVIRNKHRKGKKKCSRK